jgi:hypothetical protein
VHDTPTRSGAQPNLSESGVATLQYRNITVLFFGRCVQSVGSEMVSGAGWALRDVAPAL